MRLKLQSDEAEPDERSQPRMTDSRPVTSLANFSAVCSGIGWAVALIATLADYGRMAGATAGVGAAAFVCLVGLISGTLWLTGGVCGVLAMRQTGQGRFVGRGRAVIGVMLGILPLVLLLAYFAPIVWEELSLRF
jgi:hypothetical protein